MPPPPPTKYGRPAPLQASKPTSAATPPAPPTKFGIVPVQRQLTTTTALVLPPPPPVLRPTFVACCPHHPPPGGMPIQRMQQAPQVNPAGTAYKTIVTEWKKEENREWLKSAGSLGMIAELDLNGEKIIGYSSFDLYAYRGDLPENFFSTHLTCGYEPYNGKCAERHCLVQLAARLYAQDRQQSGQDLKLALKTLVQGKSCLAVNGAGEVTKFCAGCQTVCKGQYGLVDMYPKFVKEKTVPKYTAAALHGMNKKYAKEAAKETKTSIEYTGLYNKVYEKP